MYRNILMFLTLGWLASLIATSVSYLIETQPMLTSGVLQWATLLLLIFSFALFIAIGVRCHLDRSYYGLPLDTAFSVISKWGMRW